jgi:hypothetical protein
MNVRLLLIAGLALGIATSCVVRPVPVRVVASASIPTSGPPPAEPPPPPPPGMVSSGPIEIGCSYSAAQIDPRLGDTVQFACPPGCAQTGSTWGTEFYTADSPICRAAVHAGAMPPSGGVVTVHLEPGRPAYRGTTRYGVHSSDYSSFRASYRFLGAVAPPPVVASGPQIIEAGCSFNATQIAGEPGSAHRVSCPPGCSRTTSIWGSDFYTADSSICTAAIHAGLIGDNGGDFTVIIEPGRPAYRGTRRNGVLSADYGSFRLSYRLQR